MDDDEIFVCIAAAIVSGRFWLGWLIRAAEMFAPQCSGRRRGATLALPPLLLVVLAIAISQWADQEVRGHFGYIFLFTAIGAGSLAVTTGFSAILGADPLRDGLERGNLAATVAAGGLWLGALALNIGANIGEGATIYTTLFPLGLGMVEFMAALALAAGTTDLTAAISERRSLAAGIRFGALALAIAVPIAKAESGNWTGALDAAADLLRAGISVLLLLAVAGLVEHGIRKADGAAASPPVSRGLLPALFYLAVAIVLIWRPYLGRR